MLEEFLKKRAKKLGIPEDVLRELIPKAPEVGLKVMDLMEKYNIPNDVVKEALQSKDPEKFLMAWIKKGKKPSLKG